MSKVTWASIAALGSLAFVGAAEAEPMNLTLDQVGPMDLTAEQADGVVAGIRIRGGDGGRGGDGARGGDNTSSCDSCSFDGFGNGNYSFIGSTDSVFNDQEGGDGGDGGDGGAGVEVEFD